MSRTLERGRDRNPAVNVLTRNAQADLQEIGLGQGPFRQRDDLLPGLRVRLAGPAKRRQQNGD
jgi:hypothetical protein